MVVFFFVLSPWNSCEVGFGNISISEIKYYLLAVAFPCSLSMSQKELDLKYGN
jgi:hypothetical protein